MYKNNVTKKEKREWSYLESHLSISLEFAQYKSNADCDKKYVVNPRATKEEKHINLEK